MALARHGKVYLSMNRTPRFTTDTEGMITMAQFTTTEVAEKFETTPRTLRKFLRADARNRDAADTLPGKGSRYTLEGKDLPAMKKRFKVWTAAQAEERKARAEKVAAEANAAIEVEETEDEVQGLDHIEPTDEDLADLDD